jgi:hypothetical protein
MRSTVNDFSSLQAAMPAVTGLWLMRSVAAIVFGMMMQVLATSEKLHAQANLRLGGGVSTTYDNLQSAFNSTLITTPTGVRQLVSDTRLTGAHAAARFMVGLGDNLGFTAAAAYHRFSDLRVNIVDPAMPTASLGDLRVSQSLIPISAGLEYTLLRLGVGVYITGDLSYNFISSFTDGIPPTLATSGLALRDTFSRVGGSAGVGVDLMLFGVVGVDVCARYNHTNLIGRVGGEPEQTFFTLTASFLLGSKTKAKE